MEDKIRKARQFYASATLRFYYYYGSPSEEDCEIAIKLLDKAIEFFPDLSDAYRFREDIWHYWLKTLDLNDNSGTYNKYLTSPAWEVKKNKVMKRDNYQCTTCGARAKDVHHKDTNYPTIGKEKLSELIALCRKCHTRIHQ